MLKISKNTVYELIRRNELASYRIGRKVRIDLQDIENYKNKSRTDASGRLMGALHTPDASPAPAPPPALKPEGDIIICGQDMLLDLLTQCLLRAPYGFRALRSYVGSYSGLLELYYGKATISSVHLWDGEADEYNVGYVRHLLPGVSYTLVNLAYRTLGFYVAKGNPKGIKGWEDLTRPEVTMQNREIGCGVRVLIDESLKKRGISRRDIKGYEKFDTSHMAVASAVSRGEADAAVGNQKSARQVENIDFISIQQERLDLVIPDSAPKGCLEAVLEILTSKSFLDQVRGIGGYDISRTGEIIAKT
jgi:putative molybdopterin biosynthesis protein